MCSVCLNDDGGSHSTGCMCGNCPMADYQTDGGFAWWFSPSRRAVRLYRRMSDGSDSYLGVATLWEGPVNG